MSRPAVAVVYGPGSVEPLSLAPTLRPWCDIVWVIEPNVDLGLTRRLLERFGTVVDADSREPGTTLEELLALGVTGVTTYHDAGVTLAAAIARALDLRSNRVDVVATLVDKNRQRQALRSAGIPVPAFTLVPAGTSPSEVRGRAKEVIFPAVLKPTRGTGSRAVVRVDGEDDAAAAASYSDEDLLLEQLVMGRSDGSGSAFADLVSVELMVEDGRARALGVSGRFAFAEGFRERGQVVPAPIAASEAAGAVDLGESVVRSLGVEWGAMHLEVQRTFDGWRVIEANGRVGGILPELYAGAGCGSWWALAARIAMKGTPPILDRQPALVTGGERGPYRTSYFAVPPPTATTLGAIHGLEALRALPQVDDVVVRRRPGESVSWLSGLAGSPLFVLGHAETREDLQRWPLLLEQTAAVEYGYEPSTG